MDFSLNMHNHAFDISRASQIIAVLISAANNLLTDVIDEPTPCKYDYQ